jgi:hypothetical protein
LRSEKDGNLVISKFYRNEVKITISIENLLKLSVADFKYNQQEAFQWLKKELYEKI